jgi:hypothetical protein
VPDPAELPDRSGAVGAERCDRDGLLLGLALARRALAMSTVAPQRAEITLSPHGWNLGLNLDECRRIRPSRRRRRKPARSTPAAG